MTVEELIKELSKYPKDMLVATDYHIYDPIEIKVATWTHDNYPYDKPDVDFVLIR